MAMEEPLQTIRQQLQEHGQDHLFAFWSELSQTQQAKLFKQIAGLDLSRVDQWVAQYVRHKEPAVLPRNFAPAGYYPCQPEGRSYKQKYKQAIELGEDLIASGKVAAFVVAGGQGTRLGFDGPKGNFPATPVTRKTLFQVFAETIGAASRKYSRAIPWYIMTSPLNRIQTIQTFEDRGYFGLDRDQVFIFEQGTLPNFDLDGRILMADRDLIACSPDGHGGSLRALYDSGAVADMRSRGVELASYWQVDNPLVNLFDPLFVGLHVMDQSDMSSKALKKVGPLEKLGNFCLVGDQVTVIEYSDLPNDLAHKRRPDGALVFELGSIGIHVISRSFVERLNANGFALPLHKATKKIPHIDQTGRRVEPKAPNGVKLESFVFDALPLASHAMILETIRSEEFGPIKNATGVDSAESSRELMIERAARWLESAGVSIPRTPQGKADLVIEIAPSFALTREELAAKLHQIPKIRAKDQVYLA